MLVIAVILGPGQSRAIDGARILGVIGPSGQLRSLRVVAVTRAAGREEPLVDRDLRVTVGGGAAQNARTGPTGVAELELSEAVRASTTLHIEDAGGIVLADATITGHAVDPPRDDYGFIEGKATGDLQVVVRHGRGPVVPPFGTTLEVYAGPRIVDKGTFFADASVAGHATVTVRGGEPAKIELALTNASAAKLVITPVAEPLEIEIDAEAENGQRGSLAVTVPLAMGGFFVGDASGSELAIASPSPRPFAYASFFEDATRIGGATIPLTDGGDGFFRGTAEAPVGADRVVIASDPAERGQSTVVWPLGRAGGLPSAPQLTELAEGLSDAAARERVRLRGVRVAMIAMLALAALAEVVLLFLVGRVKSLRKDATGITGNAEHPGVDSEIPMIRIAKNAGTTLAVAIVTTIVLLIAFAAIAGVAVLHG